MFAAVAASGKAQGGKKGQGLAAGGHGSLGAGDSCNGGVGGRCRIEVRTLRVPPQAGEGIFSGYQVLMFLLRCVFVHDRNSSLVKTGVSMLRQAVFIGFLFPPSVATRHLPPQAGEGILCQADIDVYTSQKL